MKYERTLAALLCERYPALEQVRFCNSGTEANLMALTTACAVTGRDKILAFRDAYHGGVIKFPGGRCELNVPYDFVLVGYKNSQPSSSNRSSAPVATSPATGNSWTCCGDAQRKSAHC
jgi:hypothetical protein